MKKESGIKVRWLGMLLIALVVLGTSSASPQRIQLAPGTPDEQVIEVQISEMLGAWQIGDITMLKGYYADDVVVVSGAWEPPLVGWAKYLQAYMRQRERATNVRLDRTNTFIHVAGSCAWATYQWDYSAFADGNPFAARGLTTLIFQKRDSRWMVVHNHTSLIGEPQSGPPPPAVPAPQPPPKPGL